MKAQPTLSRTVVISSFTTGLKVGAALLINKVVAVQLGPSGLATLAQLQNLISIVITAGSGGVTTGITKLIAEKDGEETGTRAVMEDANRIMRLASLGLAVVLALLSAPLSERLFGSPDYAPVLLGLALSLPVLSWGVTFRAALNGSSLVEALAATNALQTVAVALLVIVGTWFFGLAGALAGLVAGHLVSVLAAALSRLRSLLPRARILYAESGGHLSRLVQFSLMTLVGALLAPLVQILIRSYIGEEISTDAAGVWEAVLRISDTYLLLYTIPLSIYFLPRLAVLQNAVELSAELRKGVGFLVMTLPLVCVAIFLLRDWIIPLLFTSEFSDVGELILPQLLGDLFKMPGWLLGYYMLARAMTKWFIAGDVIFSALFLSTSLVLIDHLGTIGACYSHLLTNALHLVWAAWLVARHLSAMRAVESAAPKP